MIFPIFSDSKGAFSAVTTVGAYLNGQAASIPFAQANDDGTRTFPDIDPNEVGPPRAAQEAKTASELVGVRTARQLVMAQRRDGQYASASRGRLLTMGAQSRTLGMYDAGRQLDLAFA